METRKVALMAIDIHIGSLLFDYMGKTTRKVTRRLTQSYSMYILVYLQEQLHTPSDHDVQNNSTKTKVQCTVR
jgi:hypothetical protein